ncbi:MAG: ABC transporter permease, partial [Candidatus Kariarchaeaceae archaeon]
QIVFTATFFLIATLGEIYVERSGVLNLGIEGMIIASAAGSYAIAYATNNIFLGILFGMLVGAILSLIHAIMTISFSRNQIISGIGLTIFGTGLSGFLGRDVVGLPLDNGLDNFPIPILVDLPEIGQIFFNQNIIVYFSYILVPILWFILFKTRVGILIRTVGENPSAAYNQGVNVRLIRYLTVIFGGMCAGISGSLLSLNAFWVEGLTQSRGWIVIALVVVALWNPLGAVIGSYLFGAFDVMQFSFQQTPIPFIFPNGIPSAILNAFPYIFTIVFLAIWAVIFSQQKIKSTLGSPTALAVPFEE